MSPADLIPGFFGKIPTTGDFVTRRLSSNFVRQWDRWAARHLVPLLVSGDWDDQVGLRFLLGHDVGGPMAGVALPSTDRVGRRFPLTVAAPLWSITSGVALSANDWFNDVQGIAEAARRGELTADGLDTELAQLTFPAADAQGEIVPGMVLWVKSDKLFDVDSDAPLATLKLLLAGECG